MENKANEWVNVASALTDGSLSGKEAKDTRISSGPTMISLIRRIESVCARLAKPRGQSSSTLTAMDFKE